jgi:hypothetical protein
MYSIAFARRFVMFAARRLPRQNSIPAPIRRRSEPKSLALLVDVVLARYGILPLDAQACPEPVRTAGRRSEQRLLFPVR